MAHGTTASTATKHSVNCRMAFGRLDSKHCPRCAELASGSLARVGWQREYFRRQQVQEQAQIAAIRTHDCKVAGCGPVCTAFEW